MTAAAVIGLQSPCAAAPGDLDATFGTPGIVTRLGSVEDAGYGVAVQGDGRVVVAGYSNNGTDYDFAVVRYTSTGLLDPTFGTGGKVTLPIGTGDDFGYGIALQADGKIVVAGTASNGTDADFAVVRLTAAGALDGTFGTGGKVVTPVGSFDDNAHAVTVQADGRIVVAGNSSNGSGEEVAVVRYEANGTLDGTFGTGGKVTAAAGIGSAYGIGVAVQGDGKILVSGSAENFTDSDFALVRFDAGGVLDATFGTAGVMLTDVGSFNDYGQNLTIQPDGKILLCGFASDGVSDAFAVVRYETDGSLDAGFGSAGAVVSPVGASYAGALAVRLQSDGKIVAAGYGSNGADDDVIVVRYTTAGAVDATFGTSGKTVIPLGDPDGHGRSLAIQSDDKIVVAGDAGDGGQSAFAATRLTAAGAIDATFGLVGRVTTDMALSADYGYSVALQPDGKVLTAGDASNGVRGKLAVTRHLPNGRLDPAFDGDGKVVLSVGAVSDHVSGVAVQHDGKILVAGSANNGVTTDFAVVRLLTDGSLDSGFGVGGMVTTQIGLGNSGVEALALQPDGKIVVTGWAQGSDVDFGVARYLANGTLDSTFGSGGKTVVTIGTGWDSPSALAIQPDGQIVVTGFVLGSSDSDFGLVRLTDMGQLDATFGAGGIVVTPVGSAGDTPYGIAVQSDGKILVCGVSDSPLKSYLSLVRYTATGALDSSFGLSGKVLSEVGPSHAQANAIMLAPDGKIIVGGRSYDGSEWHMAVARYDTGGTFDAGFGSGGQAIVPAIGTGAFGKSVAMQSDGKIVMAGFALLSTDDFALVRLEGDPPPPGTLQPTLVGTALTIADTTGVANGVTVSRSGTDLVITDAAEAFAAAPAGGTLSNGGKTLTIPAALVTTLTVNGGAGNDTLTLDFSGGDPVPTGGLNFDGGAPTAGTGDAMVLSGGTATAVTHEFASASDGTILIDGKTVAYTGLEPITDNLNATNRVFRFNGAAETVTLTDAAGSAMMIDSTLGESVTFANPTGSLTIDTASAGGAGGADVITISSVDAAFTSSITINADGGDDVNINTPLALGSATSPGNFAIVNANKITFNTTSLRTDNVANAGFVSIAGPVTLAANLAIDTDSSGTDGSITFASTSSINADAAGNNRTFSVTAGSGNVVFGGNIGSTRNVQSLAVTSAGTLLLKGVTTRTGGISLTSGGTTLDGDLRTDALAASGNITINGPVIINLSILIDTNGSGADGTFTAAGAFSALGWLQLDTGTTSVSLTNPANDFGAVENFSGGSISLVDVNDLPLFVSPITGTWNVTVGGPLSVFGTLSWQGISQLAAAGGVALTGGGPVVFDINGTTPGSGHDQLSITGTLNLAGATLTAGGTLPFTTSEIVLIDNDAADAVTGQFTGLAEESLVTVNGNGYPIRYAGGSGNDVTLKAYLPQTITFTPPTSAVYTDAFTLSATATSGLPVTISLVSGPASLVGNVLTFTGPGTVQLQATQGGNSTYAAATPVTVTITVSSPPTVSGEVAGDWRPMESAGALVSTSDGRTINGAWFASASEGWLVGQDGMIRHTADGGATWMTQVSNASKSLLGVWGVNASNVWAVGEGGTIVRWNGTVWTPQTSSSTAELRSAWGTGVNEVWVVGVGGTVLKWDGASWTAQSSGTTADFRAVTGTDASHLWAVGGAGAVRFFNGSTWVAQPSGSAQNLNGVWAADAGNIWAVGNSGTVLKSNGSTWSALTSGTGKHLRSVWGSSATNVWVVGYSGTILKGATSFAAQTAGTSENLNAVFGANASTVWAGGYGGMIVNTVNGGANWSSQIVGTSQELRAIWGTSTSDIWTAGLGGTIMRWNGTSWVNHTSGTTQGLLHIWAADPTHAWAVGGNGTIRFFNGSAWAGQASGSTQNLTGLWGVDASNVWACGWNGTILKWDGAAWTPQVTGTTQNLFGLWGTGVNDIWAVGNTGTVLHFDGTTWSAVASGTTAHFFDIWGASASQIWAVGAGGAIRYWNGSTWSAQTSGTTDDLRSVSGVSASTIWAAGLGGTILKWNGAGWLAEASHTSLDRRAIWAANTAQAFTAGTSGFIQERVPGSGPVPTLTLDEGSIGSQTGTFADPDGLGSVSLSASPFGTVTGNATVGAWSWTAPAGLNGPADSTVVTITASNTAPPAAATTTFNLVVVNVAPTATAQLVSTPQDAPLGVVLTGTDPGNDALTFVIQTLPAHGTLKDGVTPVSTVPYTLTSAAVNYAPSLAYTGADSFTFKVTDADGATSAAAATVSVSVSAGGGMGPLVMAGTQNMASFISVPQGATVLSIESTTAAGGTVSFEGQTLVYVPAAGFAGADSIKYLAQDEQGNTFINTVEVNISTADTPRAPLVRQTDGSTAITFTVTPNQRYYVQSSDGAADWVTLGTITADPYTGVATFTEPPSTAVRALYRLVRAPALPTASE